MARAANCGNATWTGREMNSVKACSKTDIGLERSINQDALFCSTSPVGKLPNLFMVADGMGGHNAGDFASRYTIKKMVELMEQSALPDPIHIVKQAVRQVNQILLEKSYEDEHLRGMGTTLTLATVIGRRLFVMNIGDSRTYLINSRIRQISRDHSFVEELIARGEMEKGSEEYWKKKNIITRAVGAYTSVIPDFFEIPLFGGEHLLLCSDGLTNMAEDDEIQKIVCADEDLETRTSGLIDLANRNGGKDNIAVILADLD